MGILDVEDNLEKGDEIALNACWKRGCSYRMTRTFFPVGHGAFYTERFNDKDGRCVFTAVYDCGGSTTKIVSEQIEKVFEKNDVVDWLFISHLHRDHVNGVSQLLNRCNVKRIVLPALEDNMIVEAILYNYIQEGKFDSEANIFIKQLFRCDWGDTQVIQVKECDENNDLTPTIIDSANVGTTLASGNVIMINNLNWRYYPINLSSNNSAQIISRLANEAQIPTSDLYSNNKLDYEKIRNIVENLKVPNCRKIYKEIFGGNHNSYSMPLISLKEGCLCSNSTKLCDKIRKRPMYCQTNCLYTGDFEAINKFATLQKVLAKLNIDYDKIGIIQVPHHGSIHNMDVGMYKGGKICIISAKSNDKRHPDIQVIQNIQLNYSIPIIVSENTNTIQRFFIPYTL